MKKIILIGSNGFIGTNLLDKLAQYDRHVVAIDRNYCEEKFSGKILKYKIDCANINAIKPLVSEGDEIIYMAFATTPASLSLSIESEWSLNIKPIVLLLDFLKQVKIKKFIYLSSGGAIYGNSTFKIIPEHEKTVPISQYGKSKLQIENYGFKYYKKWQIPFVSLRPSNAYGPGQIPFKNQGLIATAFGCLIKNKKFNLFGKNTIRDYLYIDDLVNAIILALDYSKDGEVYNIGSGEGISNINLISKINKIAEAEKLILSYNIKTIRTFDPASNILNSSKFKNISKWKPLLSFDHGLIKTWEWIKQNYA